MIHAQHSFSFDQPSRRGKLVAYFPVNDPSVPIDRLKAYEAAGVDVVELGLRTSNPYADGAIVAASMQRASGIGTVREALSAIKAVKTFSYGALGMIFAYAEDKLFSDPQEWQDVDALLALGAPGPNVEKVTEVAAAQGTRITRFVPYDLPEPAVAAARKATGFVFLQYTDGKTGIRQDLDRDLESRVKKLRADGVTAPIFAGIGISTPDQAKHAVNAGVDGVVVGSQAVLEAMSGRSALEEYLGRIEEALYG
ncbi:tryptophan synthase subunit alpha [Gymnodinialimonas sp. 57CJ19]|uniref:tryptophan synthase subunit alpha n=1 Tax=Gymnodinialimonas sp. 57CJ19 TaxID=3138498 RepID=UPI0031342B06